MLCPALRVLAFELGRLLVILETTVEPSSTVMPSVLALAAKRWLVFVTFLSLTVRRTGCPDRLPDWFVVRITVIGLEFELAAVGVLELTPDGEFGLTTGAIGSNGGDEGAVGGEVGVVGGDVGAVGGDVGAIGGDSITNVDDDVTPI